VIRLALRLASADAESVLAELLELAPSGVEEVQLDDGRVEYAVYGSPGELPDLPDLHAAAAGASIEVSSSEVADDWGERWKQFHHPVVIDSPAPAQVPAVRVSPPWDTPAQNAGPDAEGTQAHTTSGKARTVPRETVEIVIDPGQAFGTGAHATTRLCLELLLELASAEPGGGALLDIGTGSGVLAIAAAKLGYRPVIGLDHDRESVMAATQNASVNGVSIDVRRLDVRVETIPTPNGDGDDGRAPTVIVANLLRPLLLDLALAIPYAPGHLIASGLLIDEVDEIVAAYTERIGLRERERRESGEWAAVWLQADG
jgi:ribosomal protein L11 methyltransferase